MEPQFKNKEKDIRELYNHFLREELIIDRDYQREFVWNKTKRNKLIVDVCLGKAIPPIILYQNKDNEGEKTVYEVIDGQQRLLTIFSFMAANEGEIKKIQNLYFEEEVYSQLSDNSAKLLGNKNSYLALGEEHKTMLNQYNMNIIVITSTKQAAIERFTVMNTNSSSLNPHEVRRANNKDKTIIKQISTLSKELKSKFYWSNRSSEIRKLDEEFILWIYQVCKLNFNTSLDEDNLKFPSSTKPSLDKLVENNDSLSNNEVEIIKSIVQTTFEIIPSNFKLQLPGKGYFILIALLVRAASLNKIKHPTKKQLEKFIEDMMSNNIGEGVIDDDKFDNYRLIRISAKSDREKAFKRWVQELGLELK